jgi:hypothetical protein
MDLLGGYGSDGSTDESGGEDAKTPAPKQGKATKVPAKEGPAAADATNGKRKVIDFAKLPVKRPLLLESAAGGNEDAEAPLRKAAEAENLRSQAGKSLLSALPAPKVTLGSDTSSDSALRLDLSEVKAARAAAKKAEAAPAILAEVNGIMRGAKGSEVNETDEVPEELRSHPMFSSETSLPGTRPSAEELHQMKNMKFLKIGSDDMKDPDWYMNNQIAGGPGLQKKLANEVSMYEKQSWEKTTQANPSRIQKRKHQINWMAHEAMEKEAEMLDRAASSRLTKAQTSMKYGW